MPYLMSRLSRLAAAFVLGAITSIPLALRAQVITVDEGSFTVTRGGDRIGREEFRIVRQPSGASIEYTARGVAAYGDRRIAPALQTDADGAPLRYQVEVRTAAGVEERLTGQADGGRFRAQSRTPRGEAAREYVLGTGTVLVDDELFHHLFFVTVGRSRDGAAASLAPRRNAHGPTRVVRMGDESVVVAGRAIPATRLAVTSPSGRRREVWIDASGRVLKVAVPDQDVVALRDDPPPSAPR